MATKARKVAEVRQGITDTADARNFLQEFNAEQSKGLPKLVDQWVKQAAKENKTSLSLAIDAAGMLNDEKNETDKILKVAKDIIRDAVGGIEDYPGLTNRGDKYVVCLRSAGVTLDETKIPKNHRYFALKKELEDVTKELTQKGKTKPRGVDSVTFNPILGGK